MVVKNSKKCSGFFYYFILKTAFNNLSIEGI